LSQSCSFSSGLIPLPVRGEVLYQRACGVPSMQLFLDGTEDTIMAELTALQALDLRTTICEARTCYLTMGTVKGQRKALW
jgi:hypothetical protein